MTDQNPAPEPTKPEPTNPTPPEHAAQNDAALAAIQSSGLTPDDVAAASNVARAPADPLESGIAALEQRLAKLEMFAAEIKDAGAFLQKLRDHFGGKI